MTAELKRQYPVAKQLWLRVLAVSPADLEAVEGIERLVRVPVSPEPPPTELEQSAGRSVESEVIAPVPRSPTSPPSVPESYRVEQIQASQPSPKKSIAPTPEPLPDPPPRSRAQSPSAPAPSPTPAPKSSTRAETFPRSLSRRRIIQLIGLSGGGIGVAFLVQRLRPWVVPNLEPERINGSSVEFNVATVNTQKKSISIARKSSEFRTEELGNGVTLCLMVIPSGSFTMGSPDTEKEREKDEGATA